MEQAGGPADPAGALGSVHRDHPRSANVTAIVEFPPAGTLAGIAKRELRGVPTHAVKSPADLDGLTELYRTCNPASRRTVQPHIAISQYAVTPTN